MWLPSQIAGMQDSSKYADTTIFVVIAVTTSFVVTAVKTSFVITAFMTSFLVTAVTTDLVVTVSRPNATTKLVVTSQQVGRNNLF